MPLEVGDLRAVDEDILSRSRSGLLLLYLQLHDVGRMLDDLGDVHDVTRAHLAQDALDNPNETSDDPVALYGWVSEHWF